MLSTNERFAEMERRRRGIASARQAYRWAPGRIYAALLPGDTVVKIGFTIDVRDRLNKLRLRFGGPLFLLGDFAARRQEERWAHEYFRKHRSNTNGSTETYWYDAVCDEVQAMIDAKKAPMPARVARLIDRGIISGVPESIAA